MRHIIGYLRKFKVLLALVFVGVVMGLIATYAGWYIASSGPISRDIAERAGFPIYGPRSSDENAPQINKETVAYDSTNKGVSYKVAIAGTTVTITQQQTPDTFNDGPVYDHLLQKTHEFDSFSSGLGKVSLTKPDELKGTVVAVVNAPGTLLFAQANGDISKTQWQQLFSSFIRLKN